MFNALSVIYLFQSILLRSKIDKYYIISLFQGNHII